MKDLVEIIKQNPNAVAIIDNDCWYLYREDPSKNPHDEDNDASYKWEERNLLAQNGEVLPRGDGYGSGNIHGGDILQALAEIVGLKVDSV